MKRNQVSDSNAGGRSSRNDEIVSIGASARFDTLPEDCISMVIHRTSPRVACVLASVSKTVKSAAESDSVWEKFLPPECTSLVPQSLEFSSKKDMYMSLADDSVLIDDGKKSFWLEKSSGKKCYMLSAMDLRIVWIETPAHWKWMKDPESKFEKVAKLRHVCWFEIRGKMSCGMLSKGTHYSVYAVVKIERWGSFGLDDTPMVAKVGFVGEEEATRTFVLLQPRRGGYRFCFSSGLPTPEEEVEEEREISVEEPKERGDGWSEVKLGNFYNGDGGCGAIEFSIIEIQTGNMKSGLILQGIEIRPMKEGEAVATTSSGFLK